MAAIISWREIRCQCPINPDGDRHEEGRETDPDMGHRNVAPMPVSASPGSRILSKQRREAARGTERRVPFIRGKARARGIHRRIERRHIIVYSQRKRRLPPSSDTIAEEARDILLNDKRDIFAGHRRTCSRSNPRPAGIIVVTISGHRPNPTGPIPLEPDSTGMPVFADNLNEHRKCPCLSYAARATLDRVRPWVPENQAIPSLPDQPEHHTP